MSDERKVSTIWTGAFRYYLGRQTSSVGTFCDLLIEEFEDLPPFTRQLITRELKEAFTRDDFDRKAHDEFKTLGDNCDRQQWERVRNHIKGITHE